MPWMPEKGNLSQRAKMRTILIFAGIFDLALAGFFLGWGAPVLQIEYRFAWMIAAVLAAGGVIIIFVATLGFGRRGTERALDEGDTADDDGPVVRR